ncbi:MAG: hypothetical protein BRC44_01565 [Cyanobacteria bacterium QS_4_48_99]|nr:MAG: hypothetical protein BRC44_01565 [Cyanobacteria bacterium QS_4_48_99]
MREYVTYSLLENLLLGLERSEIEIAEALQLSVFERDVAAMSEGLETDRRAWTFLGTVAKGSRRENVCPSSQFARF